MSFDLFNYFNHKKYTPGHSLSEEEQLYHLDPMRRLLIDRIRPQMSLVRLNSTYMELVDFYHQFRGAPTFFGLIGSLMFTAVLFESLRSTLFNWGEMQNKEPMGYISLFLFEVICSSGFLWILWQLVRTESFRVTHYPIRLNRKNRMVYVMRRNGSILTVPWDDLYFTQRPWVSGVRTGISELWAHVLEEDRATVKETFAFYNVTGTSAGVEELWEYMRRYMEEGPKDAYQNVNICLPVGDRKEPFLFGFLCLEMVFNGNRIAQILFSPIFFLIAIGRFIASRTSKIPVWPKEVEDACTVEPDDPYAKDWRSNPSSFASAN